MITVYAKNDCGCCTISMQFKSLENATEAFNKAGLRNGAEITDDTEVTHQNIDTFYGFSEKEEEQQDRSLVYLFDLFLF